MFCTIVLPLPFFHGEGTNGCLTVIVHAAAQLLLLSVELTICTYTLSVAYCCCLPYSHGYLLYVWSLITYILLDTSVDPWHPLLLLHSLRHLWILASRTVVTSDSKMFIGGLNWDTTDGIHFTQWKSTYIY
jgi:hypothetical protein